MEIETHSLALYSCFGREMSLRYRANVEVFSCQSAQGERNGPPACIQELKHPIWLAEHARRH